MKVVSKLIANLLLLLFASDLAVSLVPTDAESTLPACCRRDGKHQCAMMQMAPTDGSPQAAAGRCPAFPKRAILAAMDSSYGLPAVLSIAGEVLSHPAGKTQTEARYRISHSRVREKRGPPFLS